MKYAHEGPQAIWWQSHGRGPGPLTYPSPSHESCGGIEIFINMEGLCPRVDWVGPVLLSEARSFPRVGSEANSSPPG